MDSLLINNKGIQSTMVTLNGIGDFTAFVFLPNIVLFGWMCGDFEGLPNGK